MSTSYSAITEQRSSSCPQDLRCTTTLNGLKAKESDARPLSPIMLSSPLTFETMKVFQSFQSNSPHPEVQQTSANSCKCDCTPLPYVRSSKLDELDSPLFAFDRLILRNTGASAESRDEEGLSDGEDELLVKSVLSLTLY